MRKSWSSASYIRKLQPVDSRNINQDVNPLWDKPSLNILEDYYQKSHLEKLPLVTDESSTVPPNKVPPNVRKLLDEGKELSKSSDPPPFEPGVSSYPFNSGRDVGPPSRPPSKSSVRSQAENGVRLNDSNQNEPEDEDARSRSQIQGEDVSAEEKKATENTNKNKEEKSGAVKQKFRPVSVESVLQEEGWDRMTPTNVSPPRVPYTTAYDARPCTDFPEKTKKQKQILEDFTEALPPEDNNTASVVKGKHFADSKTEKKNVKSTENKEKSTKTTSFRDFDELIPTAPSFFNNRPEDLDPYLIVRPPRRIHDLSEYSRRSFNF